jgi:hypothetical protein
MQHYGNVMILLDLCYLWIVAGTSQFDVNVTSHIRHRCGTNTVPGMLFIHIGMQFMMFRVLAKHPRNIVWSIFCTVGILDTTRIRTCARVYCTYIGWFPLFSPLSRTESPGRSNENEDVHVTSRTRTVSGRKTVFDLSRTACRRDGHPGLPRTLSRHITSSGTLFRRRFDLSIITRPQTRIVLWNKTIRYHWTLPPPLSLLRHPYTFDPVL